MRAYTPDRWVVVEIVSKLGTVRKVFAGWYGSYTSGDSWKLNSGITQVRIDGSTYEFDGYSGSVYKCHADGYGMSGYMAGLMDGWVKELEGIAEVRILELDEIIAS